MQGKHNPLVAAQKQIFLHEEIVIGMENPSRKNADVNTARPFQNQLEGIMEQKEAAKEEGQISLMEFL